MVIAVIDHFTIAAVSLGFGYQSLLIQTPIRIKVIGEAIDPRPFPRYAGTRKSSAPCRVQNGLGQITWL
jgi:hypothetical protein